MERRGQRQGGSDAVNQGRGEPHRTLVPKRLFELQQVAKVICDTICDTFGVKISRILEMGINSLLCNKNDEF
jgi:hypothetical protein